MFLRVMLNMLATRANKVWGRATFRRALDAVLKGTLSSRYWSPQITYFYVEHYLSATTCQETVGKWFDVSCFQTGRIVA